MSKKSREDKFTQPDYYVVHVANQRQLPPTREERIALAAERVAAGEPLKDVAMDLAIDEVSLLNGADAPKDLPA